MTDQESSHDLSEKIKCILSEQLSLAYGENTVNRLETLVTVCIGAWNYSITKDSMILEQLIASMVPPGNSPKSPEMIRNCFQELVGKKESLFASDKRVIDTCQILYDPIQQDFELKCELIRPKNQ